MSPLRHAWNGLRHIANDLGRRSGSQFKQNFIRVAQANILALLIPFLATPLLTRVFLPEDFSAAAVFASALAIVTSVSTWRFDWLIPNARTSATADCLFGLGSIVVITSSMLSFGFFLLIQLKFSDLLPQINAIHYLCLFPIAVLAAGSRQTYTGWFVRHGNLNSISTATLLQTATSTAASFVMGLAKLHSLGLIAAQTLAQCLVVILLYRKSRLPLLPSRTLRRNRLARSVLKRFGKGATVSALVSFVNTLSLNAPVLLLSACYLPREVGWYALATRIVSAPLGALVSAMGQSFWSESAKLYTTGQKRNLARLYLKTTKGLCLASLPVIVGCLLAPLVLGPLLGREQWQEAGYIVMAILPQVIGSLVFGSTNHLTVLNLQHWQLFADLIRLATLMLIAGMAAWLNLKFVEAVLLMSMASFASHLVLFLIHLGAHRRYE